jgi:lysophospholipase L1-like esterase
MNKRKKQVIHCIGDSHVSLFGGADKIWPEWPSKVNSSVRGFMVYHLGPVLAYNLIEQRSTTNSRKKLEAILKQELPSSSWVLMCFGEIDCRAHLLKQAEKKGKCELAVACDCAERYFKVLLLVKEMGHKPIAYNVIPSARKNKPKTGFPTYGNCLERNNITRLFNAHLNKLCAEQDIPFIDTFDQFVNKRGLTLSRFYMDRIHLSQKALPLTKAAIGRVLSGFKFETIKVSTHERRGFMKCFFSDSKSIWKQ